MKDKTFGGRLKHLRKFQKLTQVEAAQRIGLSYKALQDHEGGRRPNQNNFKKYLRFYGCDEIWLINGQGRPFSGQSEVLENSNKHELADGEGFYGKTRQHDVEGTHPLIVTEFEPKEGQFKGPLRAAIEGLGEIFDSNDPILIPAIQAIIHAAQISVQREYQNAQQAHQIKALEDECDEFKKRLEDLEKKLEDNPGHGYKEEPTKQKAI